MSKIQWTERTLEVTGGCTECSDGCTHCFARGYIWRLAHKKGPQHDKYRGLVEKVNGELRWTGKIVLFPEHLDAVLKHKKPTMYFVDSRADLFHKDVPFEFAKKVFYTIATCPQHTFQVLTKRAERLAEFVPYLRKMMTNNIKLPIPNLWLGVTVCNQKEADEKIPILLQTPAAVRFVSGEPLLEAIDFQPYCDDIDWFILGCESGPKKKANKHRRCLSNPLLN